MIQLTSFKIYNNIVLLSQSSENKQTISIMLTKGNHFNNGTNKLIHLSPKLLAKILNNYIKKNYQYGGYNTWSGFLHQGM